VVTPHRSRPQPASIGHATTGRRYQGPREPHESRRTSSNGDTTTPKAAEVASQPVV
jgi:hypothetical protein